MSNALRLHSVAAILNDQATTRGWRRVAFVTDHRKPEGYRAVRFYDEGVVIGFSPLGLDEDAMVCTMVAGVLAANDRPEWAPERRELLAALLEAGEL